MISIRKIHQIIAFQITDRQKDYFHSVSRRRVFICKVFRELDRLFFRCFVCMMIEMNENLPKRMKKVEMMKNVRKGLIICFSSSLVITNKIT